MARSTARSTVVTLKPDTATAAIRGAAARCVILHAMNANEADRRKLMVGMVKATAEHGLTSPEELAKEAPLRFANPESAKVSASSFNVGHNCAQVIGETATIDLIDATAKLPGTAYTGVLAACRAVVKAGKAREKAGKTGLATGKEAAEIRKTALAKAASEMAKAPRKASPGSAGEGVADSVAAFVADYAALLLRARKLATPEGRAKAWAEALNDARKAGENFALCAPKK